MFVPSETRLLDDKSETTCIAVRASERATPVNVDLACPAGGWRMQPSVRRDDLNRIEFPRKVPFEPTPVSRAASPCRSAWSITSTLPGKEKERLKTTLRRVRGKIARERVQGRPNDRLRSCHSSSG